MRYFLIKSYWNNFIRHTCLYYVKNIYHLMRETIFLPLFPLFLSLEITVIFENLKKLKKIFSDFEFFAA